MKAEEIKNLESIRAYFEINNKSSFQKFAYKLLTEIIDKYSSKEPGKEEEKWISVEDELPKEDGRYWCYVEEQNDLGLSHFQWNCAFHTINNLWSDKFKIMKVTHWQPLPNPPKQ